MTALSQWTIALGKSGLISEAIFTLVPSSKKAVSSVFLLLVTNLWLNSSWKVENNDSALFFEDETKEEKTLPRLRNLYLSYATKDKGCPKGNWICKKQAESEFHQDQNSKLWIKKGYCVPKICKRHSDCMIGDYCNGGRIGSLYLEKACFKDEEDGYLIPMQHWFNKNGLGRQNIGFSQDHIGQGLLEF